MNINRYLVKEGSRPDLSKLPIDDTGDYTDKKAAEKDLERNIERMRELQEMLYAQDIYSLLIIFQAMDAAGKDSAIEHVMTGINPQGCQVVSFKQPSAEEKDHDFLWRHQKALPGSRKTYHGEPHFRISPASRRWVKCTVFSRSALLSLS